MYDAKSIVDILPILGEMVREGIWESREEAVEEFKLRRERRLDIWHTVGLLATILQCKVCHYAKCVFRR